MTDYRPLGLPRLRRSFALVAALALWGCGESAHLPPEEGGAAKSAAPGPVAADSAATDRQGPMRVTCYKDEQVVFEHGAIYRVYRPGSDDAGWSYETGDGLKFRGRIGENVNCVWQ